MNYCNIVSFDFSESDFSFFKNNNLSHGYSNIYTASQLRIVKVKSIKDAERFKNKKVLILPDDYSADEGSMKLIAEKKKACFIVDVGRIINKRGIPRSLEIAKIRRFLKIAVKLGVFYTFADFANSPEEMRTASEIINIAEGLFDLNRGQVKFALRMVKHYVRDAPVNRL